MRKYGFHRPLSNEPWHVEMTAAARNKPVTSDAQVSQPSAVPDALSASQEAEIQQQINNGAMTPSGQPMQDPGASTGGESGAPTVVTPEGYDPTVVAAGTVAGAVVGGALIGKTGNSGGPVGVDSEGVGSTMDQPKPRTAPKVETEAGKPDASKPDAGKPSASTPDAGKPSASTPDVGKPSASTPADVNARPSTVAGAAGEATEGAAAGKARPKFGGKALPVIGTAITAAEAASIITDDEMSAEEKTRAGVELAGGTAGAWAGAKAGATGGAALGAAIGSLFFGVGAAPGAAIGGFIGGLGGGALGYWGGTELASAGYDAATSSDDDAEARKKAEEEAIKKGQEVGADIGDAVAVELASGKVSPDEVMPNVEPEVTAATVVAVAAETPKPEEEVAAEPAKLVDSTAPNLAIPPMLAAPSAAPSATAAPAAPATAAAPAAAPQQAANGSTSMLGGAAASLAGAAFGGMLPAGWGEAIMGDYANAQAIMASAQAGTHYPSTSVTPASAPVANTEAPLDNPANRSFYSTENIALQPSTLAPATAGSPVSAQAMAQSPSVTSASPATEPVERQPHEPVKAVIALTPNKQDTMMPERFQQKKDRIPASGVAQANSSRQTLDDCPVLISDGGIVLLQTGFI